MGRWLRSEVARGLRAGGRVALLSGASLLLTLLLVEGAVRVVGYQPLYSTYSRSELFWQHDALLGWSHQPNTSDVFVGPRPWPIEFETPVEINSLGLRGPEVGEPPAGGKRVLLLGDSMVAGFEVPYEKTFGALLEGELGELLEQPVQVVNGGVRGYGTDQSLLYYRERGRLLEPDLVILFHSNNDPVNNATLHRMRRPFGKPAFTLTGDGRLELLNHPTPHYPVCSHYELDTSFQVVRLDTGATRAACRLQLALFDHSSLFSFVAVRLQRNPGLIETLYSLGSVGDQPRPALRGRGYRARLTAALITELARTVRGDGADFLLIAEDRGMTALDHEELAASSIQAHPVTPHRDGDSRPYRFKNDAHYNAAGHALVSRRIGTLALAHFSPPQPERQLAGRPEPERHGQEAAEAAPKSHPGMGPIGG